MKRLLIVILAGITLLAIPATASASVKGAEHAVEREFEWDYGDSGTILRYADCRGRGNTYSCKLLVADYSGGWEFYNGRARVTQRGSRYSVSYRIYW